MAMLRFLFLFYNVIFNAYTLYILFLIIIHLVDHSVVRIIIIYQQFYLNEIVEIIYDLEIYWDKQRHTIFF